MHRRALAILLVPLAVLLAGVAWSRWSSAVRVEVARVDRGPVEAVVDQRGVTRLPKIVRITMPYEGRVEAISLTPGSKVNKGQVVGRLVGDDLRLTVARARAAVERLDAAIVENDDARVERVSLDQAIHFVTSIRDVVKAAAARVTSGREKLQYAVKNRQRNERLATTGSATEDDLDRAQLAEVESRVDLERDQLVHSAMVALEVATGLLPTFVNKTIERKQLSHVVLEKERDEAAASLARAELDLARGTMHSPIDGVVLTRVVENQRTMPAGAVLLSLGRLDDLEVEADVLSQEAVRIRPGADVTIYGPAIGDRPARGTVRRVEPFAFTKVSSLGVEQQRTNVIIRLDEAAQQRLVSDRHVGVGYRVRVRIVTGRVADALRVPRTSLFRSPQGNWQVLAVRDGVAERVTVEIGLINDRQVEVAGGVREGEWVVVTPPTDLVAGTRVRPVVAGCADAK